MARAETTGSNSRGSGNPKCCESPRGKTPIIRTLLRCTPAKRYTRILCSSPWSSSIASQTPATSSCVGHRISSSRVSSISVRTFAFSTWLSPLATTRKLRKSGERLENPAFRHLPRTSKPKCYLIEDARICISQFPSQLCSCRHPSCPWPATSTPRFVCSGKFWDDLQRQPP